MSRLPSGGRIDRTVTLSFTFDGKRFTGYRGDTLASALLAHGVHRVSTSLDQARPRGIVSAGVEEPCALVQVETPFPEPMLTATTVELVDGLVARGLTGRGRLADQPDPARYDRMHAHCELLVVGAGPAGLSAALTAARSGVRVVLVDDQSEPGGSLLSDRSGLAGPDGWLAGVVAELRAAPDVRLLSRTSAFGYYDDGFVLAVEHRGDPVGSAQPVSRQRIWRIRAARVLLATGSHERPVVFTDNDRPGIMLAGAARVYLNRYAVLPGRQVVVFTTNDSGYPVALELAEAGAEVSVVDVRSSIAQHWQAEFATHGVRLLAGQAVAESFGENRVTGVRLVGVDESGDGAGAGNTTRLDCDLLLVSGGWNPAVHLYSQARGALEYRDDLGAFVPVPGLPGVRVAGAVTGRQSLAGCLADGTRQAVEALAELGVTAIEIPLPALDDQPEPAPAAVLWQVRDPDAVPRRQFVDLQRDATVADLRRATGAGLRSVEHLKRYTTIGTAHDQGKTSGALAVGIAAELLGVPVDRLGTTTFRPPYTPVAFAALAGRDRGELFDPARLTALHGWHAEHGAVFENVGQWKRPYYYPTGDESMAEAVSRECRAARSSVALMDGSTLGKITVQGIDAGEFLDRIYTNLISTLKVGFVRYGVMCGLDGMIIDDGTVLRVSETEFLLTTTTGNAAMVLDWLEEFAQTEWPQLRVSLTSVTEHWVTIPLVGPNSRAVLAAVAPELDVSNEAFGFMTWRSAKVAGVQARVCRISFSGELAYEVNVAAWYGLAVWQALLAAGEPYGITAYGTEAMHVLRAEKGYPIIGQDTDGTVTPQDLGMSWVISKKKPDYLGKRSHSRPENLRADRKHLVGLLPSDPTVLLSEGAQLLAEAPPSGPIVEPVPMLGHVTSSYRSDALRSSFGLALLRGGRDRIGQQLLAWQDGELVPVTVTGPVLFDPEGARRDG